MDEHKKLTNDEYATLFRLLKRHAETEMDQFDLWKLESRYGDVFISVSREAFGSPESYSDISTYLARNHSS